MFDETRAHSSDPTLRYALLGGAFGAAFPLAGTLLEMGIGSHAYGLGSALRVQAGMDDYVSKPINPTELFEAISRSSAERRPG